MDATGWWYEYSNGGYPHSQWLQVGGMKTVVGILLLSGFRLMEAGTKTKSEILKELQ